MDLTLYALARARSLFEAGASVEEVYEALSERPKTEAERPKTGAGRMAQAGDRNASPNPADSPTVATVRASYLLNFGEPLQASPYGGTGRKAIPAHDVFRRAEPAAGGKKDKTAAPKQQGSSDPAAGDPATGELRDQIAVAVTQIAVLKDNENRQRSDSGPSARAI